MTDQTWTPEDFHAAVGLRPHYAPCDFPDRPCSCGAAEDRPRIAQALADRRAELAALLRTCAAGRTEYAGGISLMERNPVLREQRRGLEIEAQTLENAARIVEGDDGPLYGLLPSWRWTDEMEAKLFGRPRSEDPGLSSPASGTAAPA